MKSEKDWLKCFKANLEDHLSKEPLLQRQNIIIWELSWVEDRLDVLVGVSE